MGAGRMLMTLAAIATVATLAAISYQFLKDRKKKKKKKMKDHEKKKMKKTRIKKTVNKKRKKKELQQQLDPQQAQTAMRHRRSLSASSEFVGEMPSDLGPDILSRLPVKSIARFRCVCKQWRSLTYDAAFRELHCKRKPHTIFVPDYGRGELPVYELGPADGQISEYCPPLVLMGSLEYGISNPVDGLVVAYLPTGSESDFWLVNPATREQSSLPASKRQAGAPGCHVGFGFDASTGKYKLVRMLRIEGSLHCYYEILTVGTLEWRSIGETPCWVNPGQSVFLNGAIYWMSLSLESMSLLAFDIKDEKFQSISTSVPVPIPTYALLGWFSLHQFGGRFFLLESPFLPDQPFLRIWTLTDDVEGHEWKEECEVDMSLHSNTIRQEPIHLLDIKDGKLMLQQSPSIYSYDLQSRALQEIYPLSGFFEVGPLYPMAESFISPKSLTDTSTL